MRSFSPTLRSVRRGVPSLSFTLALLATNFAFGQKAADAPVPTSGGDTSSTSEQAVQLSVFEVNTSKDTGYQSADQVSATRIATPLVDVPQFITVFNPEFLKDTFASELADVLVYDPDINPTGDHDSYNMRGFSSLDATAVNDFAQIKTGLLQASLVTTDRLEIIKGPNSITFGDAAFGGVVDRLPAVVPSEPTAGVDVTVGSGPLYKGRLSVGGPIARAPVFDFFQGSTLSYNLIAFIQKGKTWGGRTSNLTALNPQLEWRIGRNTDIIVGYSYIDQLRMAPWQLPVHAGNPYGVVLGNGQYRAYPTNTELWQPGDSRRDYNNRADLDIRERITDNWQLRFQGQLEKNNQDIDETQPDNTSLIILNNTALMQQLYREIPDGAVDYRTREELTGELNTGPVRHRLLVGWSGEQYYDKTSEYLSPTNNGGSPLDLLPNVTSAQLYANPAAYGFTPGLLPVDIWNPHASTTPIIPIGGPYPVPLYLDAWSASYYIKRAYYATDMFSVLHNHVDFQFGYRYEHENTYALNRISGTFPLTTVLNPNAKKVLSNLGGATNSEGVVYHVDQAKTVNLYLNKNTAFVPQATVDPDGSTFPPQEANQTEAGIKSVLWGGKINTQASWFYLVQQNVIVSDPNRVGYHILVNGTRSKGADFNVSANWTKNWQMFGGYSYIDARNERSVPTGAVVAQQPHVGVSAFNRYQFNTGALKGLYFTLGTIYRSESAPAASTTRSEPAWSVPGYIRWDGGGGYKFNYHKIEYVARWQVKNLASNNHIILNATNSRVVFEPGREWEASFGANF